MASLRRRPTRLLIVSRFLIDAVDLGRNEKGISRVLASLVPALLRSSSDEILVACTTEGAALLDAPESCLHLVRLGLKSKWEQWGLPRLASGLEADAVYSHREAGSSLGPTARAARPGGILKCDGCGIRRPHRAIVRAASIAARFCAAQCAAARSSAQAHPRWPTSSPHATGSPGNSSEFCRSA